jgi:hypothetical protein
MTFDESFPLKLYLNLNKHEERRRHVLNELLDARIEDAERVPAFAGKWFKDWRGYSSGNRYAQALSHKLAVWTGWRRHMPAVLVFEDDVVLAAELKEQFERLELPEDWAIFYFGCQHLERPEIVGPGIVRCRRTFDMHAYAVRASAYGAVAKILTPFGKGSAPPSALHSCDAQLSLLSATLPVYAAWPNLAWQLHIESEAQEHWWNDNYSNAGRQSRFPEAVEGLDEEMKNRFGAGDGLSSFSVRNRRIWQSGAYLNWSPANIDFDPAKRLGALISMRLIAKLQGQTLRLLWPGPGATAGRSWVHDDVLEASGYEVVAEQSEWHRVLMLDPVVDSTSEVATPGAAWAEARRRGLAKNFTEASSYFEWKRLAGQLRPSRHIQERINFAMRRWRARHPLGFVHPSRDESGDEGKVDETERGKLDEALLNEIRRKCAADEFDGVFVSADRPDDIERWAAWLEAEGIPLLESERIWRAASVGQQDVEDIVVDIFLLARCDAIVSDRNSPLVALAMAVGQLPEAALFTPTAPTARRSRVTRSRPKPR